MSTPHNEAKKGEIASTVIMPGDPLRAKYIAENFLQNAKLVNQVRGMYAYTGTYQGKEITVMASGMGMPSMAIYCYELYEYYDVKNIIRIGSCGAYQPNLKMFDIILANQVYTESVFAYSYNNEDCHLISADNTLNNIIVETSVENKIPIVVGTTICMDCFDAYMPDFDKFWKRLPKGLNPIAAEMEAFALLYIANMLNKKATCLMSVVDSRYTTEEVTAEQRQTGLNNMIKLALDSIAKL